MGLSGPYNIASTPLKAVLASVTNLSSKMI
jgi:hypothetical protein